MLSVATKSINLIAFMLNVFMLVVIMSNALTHKLVVIMLKVFMLVVIMLMVFMHAGRH
jgi:hypothetical protein